LGQELESAFTGAEIWDMEAQIGVQDSYEGDPRKIQTLGDHLRADQEVELSGFEGVESVAKFVFAAHGIGIDAGGAGGGEDAAESFFDSLGSVTGEADGRGLAFRAGAEG
jgi:hypothetical protein